MKDNQLNLLNFGYNDEGEFVDLVEEEKRKSDLAIADYEKRLEEHENPLVRILAGLWCSRFGQNTFNETLEQLDREVESKCYHYGNLEKLMFVFTLETEDEERYFIFENKEHYLLFVHGISNKLLDEYLLGNKTLSCPALGVEVYDKQGHKIWKFGDKDQDIRYQCIINEWHMNKFGTNRMDHNKKIKDFYEIEFTLPKLIEYWGESEIENGTT